MKYIVVRDLQKTSFGMLCKEEPGAPGVYSQVSSGLMTDLTKLIEPLNKEDSK